MARVLIYIGPGAGHVYPPIETALKLRERGHDVAVRAEAGSVETLAALGLAAAPIDPRIEEIELEDWRARTPLGALKSAVETFAAQSRFEVPDALAAIEAERPDLVWVDINAPGAALAAEAAGLPWAHFMPYPYPWPAEGVPAFGPGFPPPRGRLGRARDRAATAFGDLVFRSFVRELNSLGADLGLAPVADAEELSLAAPLQILFSAEPFEYPRRWPSNVRLVGPALWEPAALAPEWLEGEDRPIALVTASTLFQDDAKLISATLEALADTEYAVIATTAAHDPGEFRAPPNARVERRLPHTPIIRRAAVVISHGGMGITLKTLAAGVPVCVVPFYRDQLEVARRAERCGAGTFLSPRRLSPARLRAAVEEARTRQPDAERVSQGLAAAGGAAAAADALEALLA